jgi:hypothetical protein
LFFELFAQCLIPLIKEGITLNLDAIAIHLAGLCAKKSTAIVVEVLLIILGLYLIFIEESPYALLFQTPVVVVCIIVNTFWIMELNERENKNS